MIPRTGSLGLTRDLWALTHAACYDPDPVVGHSYDLGSEQPDLARRLGDTVEGFDAGFMRDPDLCDTAHTTVPFHPKCKTCRRAGKRVLERRGLNRVQIMRCFAALGAKWDWTTPAKERERRESDHGLAIIDPAGPGVILDSTLRARQRRAEKRIEQSDRKARMACR